MKIMVSSFLLFLHCNSQSYGVHEEITRLLSAITPITHSIIANPSQQDMRHNLLLHGIDTSPCLSLYHHKAHSISEQGWLHMYVALFGASPRTQAVVVLKVRFIAIVDMK